ncbi:TOMM precursor leader peptide-binding protein [Kutzneria buriramensis]|uniref:Ribosomal protein S12 methylthiotransferase accessory factor n=1 Tax=Kutzneria buriramensis TaxID=1045776 RepID=A0A3E0H4B0_9PSEU|nr:TOMM precursor leader peptide-binding protein [Kutzneria buriramensis]REH38067.1 ribosomal protein S12 methylthiotransferase accessory factor [Kutzneria buriramensis]
MSPRTRIGLSGSGALHTGIRRLLADEARLVPVIVDDPADGLDRCRALVLASDAWDTRAHTDAQAACAAAGVPWLPVFTRLGHAVIGPVTRPRVAGCATCADLRGARARLRGAEVDAVWERNADAFVSRPSSWLTALGSHAVAALAVEEVRRLVDGSAPPRTDRAVLHLHLDDITVTTHRLLPDPLCPACGSLPDDTAERAEITLWPRPKPAPDTYRVRSVAAERDELIGTYVDAETGLIRTVDVGDEAGVAVAVAGMGLRGGGNGVEWSWGRSDSYRTSELTAVLESLERWGGMQPGGKRTTVRARFPDVRAEAVDPRSLGLYPPERYGPSFPFVRFDDDLELDWVWGYSFARRRPVLVPESCAYYGLHRTKPREPKIAFETSNGCALGGCLEEAILHGILEVAERDAFLMTWYARMGVPRIDLDSARDRRIPLLRQRIEDETGWRILAFDTTVEQRIPCVWLLAVNAPGSGDEAKTVSTGGAHLEPEHALRNALFELGPVMSGLNRTYLDNADRARRMAEDSSLVHRMTDHSLLYASPAVFDRFDFLMASTGRRTVAEMAGARPPARNVDLTSDLIDMVGRYLDTGLDVVVVDQTTPEHRIGGFSCVKVIIPGTLPMTFGHEFRRVHGLPRLHRVPHALGYRDAPLPPEKVNPYPHPFP